MDQSMRAGDQEHQVLLVVPPVLSPHIPTLGAAVLAAACTNAGIPARVHYASVSFAGHVGFELCERLAAAPPRRMLGEAVFMAAAFPERAHRHARTLEALAQAEDPLAQFMRPAALNVAELADCAAAVPNFISETVERLLAGSPRIIGISSMCQQILPSIALAREIKRVRPEVITVLGGANAAEPMGSGFLEMTDAFDFIFSGEADVEFPAFCRAYLEEGKLPARRVITCSQVPDLDCVAMAVYDDYLRELETYRAGDAYAARAPYWLIFESSRGCWWSEKLGCTFCGFNVPGGRYRTKSPERLLTEIKGLVDRYGVRQMYASDTIMAQDFPRTVLSQVAEQGVDIEFSYEVKSNLKAEDLDTFVRAGVVEIQPGIESLSDHILQLMDKGVRALENVRFLRDACSRRIEVVWNFLTAIPGETRDDYENMLALIPLLEHLRPPTRWGPIRVSRYSPYHRDPARYGIGRLTPWPVYAELFGEYAELIAQHFTGEYETEFTRDAGLRRRFDEALRRWSASWFTAPQTPALQAYPQQDGSLLIYDSRAVARATAHILSPGAAQVLHLVHEPVHAARLAEEQRGEVEALVELGLAASYQGQFLSLVTEPEIGEQLWHERRRILTGKRSEVSV